MQSHVKVWLDIHHLSGHEAYIPCEICNGRPVVDIHHIRGRIGKLRNDPDNLLGLCRDCHTACHSGAISREFQDKIIARRNEH